MKSTVPVILDRQANRIVKAIPKRIPVQFEFPNMGIKPDELVNNLWLPPELPSVKYLSTDRSQPQP